MAARDRIKGTLSHYFATLFEKAGMEWTDGNEAEIEQLADDLADLANRRD